MFDQRFNCPNCGSGLTVALESPTPVPTPTPTPSPVPTPTPSPTPAPGGLPTQEVPFQTQRFQHVEPGIMYYIPLPFPFTSNLAVQFGAGNEGSTPTHMNMTVSEYPDGRSPGPYPQSRECDPSTGGDTIYASLNPDKGRDGKPLYQAQVTPNKQNYVCFSVNEAGGVVYGIS